MNRLAPYRLTLALLAVLVLLAAAGIASLRAAPSTFIEPPNVRLRVVFEHTTYGGCTPPPNTEPWEIGPCLMYAGSTFYACEFRLTNSGKTLIVTPCLFHDGFEELDW